MVLVVLALLIITDSWRIPGAPAGPQFESSSSSTSSSSASAQPVVSIPVQNVSITPPRTLTHEDPLRVWIGGDSLAGTLGPALGELLGDTGVVKPVYNSRVSSGLTSPSFYNWPKNATANMKEYQPEVAVFIIGANDTGVVVPSKPDAWVPQYRAYINSMLDILSAGGFRQTIWVSAPRLKNESMDTRVSLINALAREEVEKRKNATFVDAYALFSDKNGDYASVLPVRLDGTTKQVRTADGVHFTVEGGDVLGAKVYEQLNSVWDLESQRIEGSPYPVVPVRGSTRVAGTSRNTTASTVTPSSVTPDQPSGTTGTNTSTASSSASSSTSSSSAAPNSSTTTTTTTSALANNASSSSSSSSPPPPPISSSSSMP